MGCGTSTVASGGHTSGAERPAPPPSANIVSPASRSLLEVKPATPSAPILGPIAVGGSLGASRSVANELRDTWSALAPSLCVAQGSGASPGGRANGGLQPLSIEPMSVEPGHGQSPSPLPGMPRLARLSESPESSTAASSGLASEHFVFARPQSVAPAQSMSFPTTPTASFEFSGGVSVIAPPAALFDSRPLPLALVRGASKTSGLAAFVDDELLVSVADVSGTPSPPSAVAVAPGAAKPCHEVAQSRESGAAVAVADALAATTTAAWPFVAASVLRTNRQRETATQVFLGTGVLWYDATVKRALPIDAFPPLGFRPSLPEAGPQSAAMFVATAVQLFNSVVAYFVPAGFGRGSVAAAKLAATANDVGQQRCAVIARQLSCFLRLLAAFENDAHQFAVAAHSSNWHGLVDECARHSAQCGMKVDVTQPDFASSRVWLAFVGNFLCGNAYYAVCCLRHVTMLFHNDTDANAMQTASSLQEPAATEDIEPKEEAAETS